MKSITSHLQQDGDLAVPIFSAAAHVEGAGVQGQSVQLRQLVVAHLHVLELAAPRQHGQELRRICANWILLVYQTYD